MTDFKPMLAKDGDLAKIGFPQIAQRKLDGIRAVVKDGVVLSRTLKPIPNAEIQVSLGRPEFEGFDGELIVGPITAPDCYRTTSSFVMAPNKTGEPWCFHVFDLWNSSASYALRYDRLRMLVRRMPQPGFQPNRIALVENVRVDSLAELDAIEAAWLAEGQEGVILRDPAGLYKFGRSGKTGPLIKVKRFIDFEARVVGVYEEMHNANEAKTNELGRTARSSAQAGKVGKGTLGGLVLRAINGPAVGVEFRCGTGFDAATRRDLWAYYHRNDCDPQTGEPLGDEETHDPPLVGSVAKIKSFPIGVKDKPRHPVFLGWRDMGVDG
jgi:DNA ligase-1